MNQYRDPNRSPREHIRRLIAKWTWNRRPAPVTLPRVQCLERAINDGLDLHEEHMDGRIILADDRQLRG